MYQKITSQVIAIPKYLRNIRVRLVVATVMLILSACQMPHSNDVSISNKVEQQTSDDTVRQSDILRTSTNPAQEELFSALTNYDNENFKISEKEFKNALHSNLLDKHDQVIAHKYLAFIYCTSKRKKLCQHEFRNALHLNRSFKLSDAEAGHPIWGPVFSSEKAKFEQSIFAPKKN